MGKFITVRMGKFITVRMGKFITVRIKKGRSELTKACFEKIEVKLVF